MASEWINFCACPRDGIGRHAWLKTTSRWGPGSSPGVGNVLQALKFRLANPFKSTKNLIVLRDKSKSLYVLHSIVILSTIFITFWLPWASMLFSPLTTLQHIIISSFHSVPETLLVSYDVPTINNSSTTSIAHAAFFYLFLAIIASLLFLWN